MEITHRIDNKEIDFVSGTAVNPLTGKRVEAIGYTDPKDGSMKLTCDLDCIPTDMTEARDVLENYSWETADDLMSFKRDENT